MSVQAYIKDNPAALCALLQELVRIPTVNPPGENYAEIVGLLEAKCQALGMQTQIAEVPTERAEQVIPNAESHPRSNLIARWDVGAEKTVHFNAHYDVVPVAGEWRFNDPFSGEIDGEWLYGRGSDDMKTLSLHSYLQFRLSKRPTSNHSSISNALSPVMKRPAGS